MNLLVPNIGVARLTSQTFFSFPPPPLNPQNLKQIMLLLACVGLDRNVLRETAIKVTTIYVRRPRQRFHAQYCCFRDCDLHA